MFNAYTVGVFIFNAYMVYLFLDKKQRDWALFTFNKRKVTVDNDKIKWYNMLYNNIKFRFALCTNIFLSE